MLLGEANDIKGRERRRGDSRINYAPRSQWCVHIKRVVVSVVVCDVQMGETFISRKRFATAAARSSIVAVGIPRIFDVAMRASP